jgi:hypothetical protein
LTPH